MSQCPFDVRLGALHDGELPAAAAREVEGHAATCEACGDHLRELRELSGRLADARPRGALTADALARLHASVPPMARPLTLPRLGGFLSAAAASILIVSLAWLSVPRSHDPLALPTSSSAESWQTTARSLEPPVPGDAAGHGHGVALRDTARWMVQSMNGGGPTTR